MAITRNFSMSEINSGHHNLPTYEMSMKSDNVEFVRIVVAILKMATARYFSMSGIYSGHHNLPTYKMSLKSDNFEFVRHCRGHFENGDC
jgi:5-carboxymethyl-2-hydroxymuconate isomerase